MIGKYIDIRFFIISLALGFLYVYLYQPDTSVIYVYPTPDNIDTVLYKDRANNCYKFNMEEVSCDEHKNNISTIPFQG